VYVCVIGLVLASARRADLLEVTYHRPALRAVVIRDANEIRKGFLSSVFGMSRDMRSVEGENTI